MAASAQAERYGRDQETVCEVELGQSARDYDCGLHGRCGRGVRDV